MARLLASFLLLTLALTWPAAAQPEPTDIEGMVRDAVTGSPVPGVLVQLVRTDTGETIAETQTDAQGQYVFVDINTSREPPSQLRPTVGAFYPNPARRSAQVDVHLRSAATLTATLVNVLGQTLYAETFALAAGRHALRLDGGALAAGRYFVRLDVDEPAGRTRSETRSLTLVGTGRGTVDLDLTGGASDAHAPGAGAASKTGAITYEVAFEKERYHDATRSGIVAGTEVVRAPATLVPAPEIVLRLEDYDGTRIPGWALLGDDADTLKSDLEGRVTFTFPEATEVLLRTGLYKLTATGERIDPTGDHEDAAVPFSYERTTKLLNPGDDATILVVNNSFYVSDPAWLHDPTWELGDPVGKKIASMLVPGVNDNEPACLDGRTWEECIFKTQTTPDGEVLEQDEFAERFTPQEFKDEYLGQVYFNAGTRYSMQLFGTPSGEPDSVLIARQATIGDVTCYMDDVTIDRFLEQYGKWIVNFTNVPVAYVDSVNIDTDTRNRLANTALFSPSCQPLIPGSAVVAEYFPSNEEFPSAAKFTDFRVWSGPPQGDIGEARDQRKAFNVTLQEGFNGMVSFQTANYSTDDVFDRKNSILHNSSNGLIAPSPWDIYLLMFRSNDNFNLREHGDMIFGLPGTVLDPSPHDNKYFTPIVINPR